MIVLSNRYSTIASGYSIITLYTTVILVLGNLLRSSLSFQIGNIPYSYSPNPNGVLQLCRSIILVREQGKYREQKLLFSQLIDLIRSAQMLKLMGGSYHKYLL